mmetsp:Transcript_4080/g.7267  ORF Transcript_4080/g.7267 Transcript_4080/m.7267 type:complete len:305 (-) Transcript_4080:78-992(-)
MLRLPIIPTTISTAATAVPLPHKQEDGAIIPLRHRIILLSNNNSSIIHRNNRGRGEEEAHSSSNNNNNSLPLMEEDRHHPVFFVNGMGVASRRERVVVVGAVRMDIPRRGMIHMARLLLMGMVMVLRKDMAVTLPIPLRDSSLPQDTHTAHNTLLPTTAIPDMDHHRPITLNGATTQVTQVTEVLLQDLRHTRDHPTTPMDPMEVQPRGSSIINSSSTAVNHVIRKVLILPRVTIPLLIRTIHRDIHVTVHRRRERVLLLPIPTEDEEHPTVVEEDRLLQVRNTPTAAAGVVPPDLPLHPPLRK